MYDGYGRLKTKTDPPGLVTETTYSWDAAGTNGLYCITQTTTGNTTQKTWYDAMGREVRQSSQRFDGLWAKTDKLYDSYGRLQKTSLPFTGSSASYWDTYSYDSYDRPLTVTRASGKITRFSYDGLKTTTTEDGIATARTSDALGKLVKAEDPGGAIIYTLRANGQPSTIEAPGGIITTINYDEYGRQTSIVDPSAGTTSYGYDAAGNLNKQTDAEGRVTNMVFDDYGRITSKSWPEFSTSYNYNADALLETVTSDNGTSIAYTYDIYDRLKTEKETGADGLWLEKGYTYKTDGNLETQTYKIQDGTITSEHYTYNYGELTEIKLNGTTSVFKLTAENALGQPTAVTTGPLVRQYGYSIYGIPTGRTAGSWQDAGYNFETATGNLLSRTDKTRSKTESFGYDQLNRLTDYGSYTANYDAKGNLTGKTDVGTFYYTNSSKPYALSGADLASNAVPLRNQNITYSSFEQPLNIAENGYMAGFTYNAEGQRVKMELQQNGIVHLVRHYLGACYEKDLGVGGTKEKLYLGGDAYSAPAVYVKQGSGSWQLYYICRDYLGSITHLANSSGSLIQELSYDAWGRLRNPATQTAYAPGSEPELFLGRGYTGHEHLAWFGLVNMNGRLYDPAVGRFLSPDIHVQEPDNSQSFNRYGYCLNNPLKYIDPSGYTWLSQLGKWISKNGNQIITIAATVVVVAAVTVATAGMGTLAAGAIIGAAGGFTSGAVGTWLSGGSFWGGVGSGLINGAVGAVAGMAGGVAAQWASKSIGSFAINGLQVSGKSAIGGFVSGAVGGTAGGAAGGFATGLLMTGDIDEAFKMAGQGAIYGGIAGGALGAYRGFRDAKALGNNPWTGKQNKVEITKSKFGHTFDNHGESATEFVTKRASGSGSPQGQFLDDQAAAKFINENLGRTANGAVDIPMPKGFPARVINPNGTISTPTHIRLVPGGNGVKTAYPLTKF